MDAMHTIEEEAARLCCDVCGYCTLAIGPRQAGAAYLSPDEVLAIARAGREAGCREALFTLGDKPELRYEAARSALRRLGPDGAGGISPRRTRTRRFALR